jgi:hypothetical protein
MKQDELWKAKYDEIVEFIKQKQRNPSKHDAEERGLYCNWLKYNRKMYNSGEMKEERRAQFEALLGMMDQYRRKNQYDPKHALEEYGDLFNCPE